jgi:hypothetical protein
MKFYKTKRKTEDGLLRNAYCCMTHVLMMEEASISETPVSMYPTT